MPMAATIKRLASPFILQLYAAVFPIQRRARRDVQFRTTPTRGRSTRDISSPQRPASSGLRRGVRLSELTPMNQSNLLEFLKMLGYVGFQLFARHVESS